MAGDIVSEFRARKRPIKVELKSGHDPVTPADRAASKAITGGLRAAFGADIVISEEAPDDLRRRRAPRVWYVDPLDGTKAFIRGETGFCVMVGLAVNHQPRLGVIYVPSTRALIWGTPEGGAWIQFGDSPPKRIRPSRVKSMAAAVSRQRRPNADSKALELCGVGPKALASIGLQIALVAMGGSDAFMVKPSFGTSSWDTCAPEAIVRAAGGTVSDVYGDPTRYDGKTGRHENGLVASNGPLHAEVIGQIAPLFPRRKKRVSR